jgi:hypothetical protein
VRVQQNKEVVTIQSDGYKLSDLGQIYITGHICKNLIKNNGVSLDELISDITTMASEECEVSMGEL